MFYTLFEYIYITCFNILQSFGLHELQFYYDLELNCANNVPGDYAEYFIQGSVADYLAMICMLVVFVLLLLFVIKLFKIIFNAFSGN